MSELFPELAPWERETQHAEKALENRAGPFHLPGTAQIMIPILEMLQEVEDMFWDIFDQRFLANATGDALEILGAIIGEDKLDDTEDEFKLRLSLKLRAINSNKRGLDFIELLGLLEGRTWNVTESRGVVVIIQLSGPTVSPDTLIRYLDIASADGVTTRLETPYTEDAADVFTWPSQDGSVPGGEWGSQDGAIVGDNWHGVKESRT